MYQPFVFVFVLFIYHLMNENIHGKIICHLMNEKITWAPTKGNNLRPSTLVAWAMAATKSMHQVLQFNMPKASYRDHLSDSTPFLITSPPGSLFFPPTNIYSISTCAYHITNNFSISLWSANWWFSSLIRSNIRQQNNKQVWSNTQNNWI